MINGTIAGNLGKAAELKQVSGKPVLNFSVAVKMRDKSTQWVRCALWGTRGEKLAEHLTQGTKVTVVGTLKPGVYDGKPQLDCDVQEITLQGGGKKDEESGGGDGIPF